MDLTNQELRAKLSDDQALKKLYKKLLPSIEHFLIKNSGKKQEAKDLLQEALMITFKKSRDPSFSLSASLETFVYAVAKRRWMYDLSKRKEHHLIMDLEDESNGNNIQAVLINQEKVDLYRRYFEQLPAGCRELLTYFFQGLKMIEIAKKMNFASEGYTRKRKHTCQNKLISSIKKDPLFNELVNE